MNININDYVKFYDCRSRKYVIARVIKIEKVIQSIDEEEVNKLYYIVDHDVCKLMDKDIKGVYKDINTNEVTLFTIMNEYYELYFHDKFFLTKEDREIFIKNNNLSNDIKEGFYKLGEIKINKEVK